VTKLLHRDLKTGGFMAGAANVELVLRWRQPGVLSMHSREQVMKENQAYGPDASVTEDLNRWANLVDGSTYPTYIEPGKPKPFAARYDPWQLKERLLNLSAERDDLLAFLGEAGYEFDEPRQVVPIPTLGYNAEGFSELHSDEEFSVAFKRAADRRFGAWNHPLTTGLEALWNRRRQFLREWTLAGTAQCVGISSDLAQRYPQEYDEAAFFGTQAFITWGEGRSPRVILSASQGWTAILATVHVDQLRGREYRVCAHKTCE
jgi:hypothetical protein